MKYLKYLFLFSFVSSFFFSSCKKDALLTDSSAKLDFSTDSVLFDTVFTTLGSTTKAFRIYNKHSRPMNISRIYLARGASSPFKINVDGVSGKSISDVEILGGDSLFVFVQVTVDPTGVSNPLLIKDSIVFETNNNKQDVKLTAVGQDVYLHRPNHFPTNGFPAYSIIGCNETWTNDKPHLIFGYAVIDSACTLTMMPGTRVYLYNGAALYVYKDGTLKVKGNKGNEVTFQGTRLEPAYNDVPGQWGQIYLSALSKDNEINYAIIKNGGIGIRADTMASLTVPTLRLSNTIIKNMTAAALYGLGAHIRSYNCVFANCGQIAVDLSIGGNYSFEHCTLANYWSGTTARTTPLLLMNNYYQSGSVIYVRPLDSCYFLNCIIDGNLSDEVGIDSITAAGGYNFSFEFDHCFLRTSLSTSSAQFYTSCLKNLSSGFHNTTANDYRLDAGSNARNTGSTTISPSVYFDLNNMPRPNSTDLSIPDMGAYEYYP